MGRYLLSGLLLLAFGALNAFAAEIQRSLRLALVRFATRKSGRCANLVWSAIRGAWQGRSMRERHGTGTGRTDNTPTRPVKFKQRCREADE